MARQLIAIATLLLSQTAWSADLWICNGKSMPLSFVEARSGDHPVLMSIPGQSLQEKTDFLVQRVAKFDSLRASRYTATIQDFSNHAEHFHGTEFATTPDWDDTLVSQFCPKNLKIEQPIVYKHPEFPEDPPYWINDDLWNPLSDDFKAVLLLEMAIHREVFDTVEDPYGTLTDAPIRRIAAELASSDWENVSLLDYVNVTYWAGLDDFDFYGTRVVGQQKSDNDVEITQYNGTFAHPTTVMLQGESHVLSGDFALYPNLKFAYAHLAEPESITMEDGEEMILSGDVSFYKTGLAIFPDDPPSTPVSSGTEFKTENYDLTTNDDIKLATHGQSIIFSTGFGDEDVDDGLGLRGWIRVHGTVLYVKNLAGGHGRFYADLAKPAVISLRGVQIPITGRVDFASDLDTILTIQPTANFHYPNLGSVFPVAGVVDCTGDSTKTNLQSAEVLFDDNEDLDVFTASENFMLPDTNPNYSNEVKAGDEVRRGDEGYHSGDYGNICALPRTDPNKYSD